MIVGRLVVRGAGQLFVVRGVTGKAAVCNDERDSDQVLVENGSQVEHVYRNKGDALHDSNLGCV